MRIPASFLCAVPPRYWEPDGNDRLSVALREVQGTLRRVRKAVNLEADRTRLDLAFGRLEAVASARAEWVEPRSLTARWKSDTLPSFRLGAASFEMLVHLARHGASENGLAAGVVPPSDVAAQRQRLRSAAAHLGADVAAPVFADQLAVLDRLPDGWGLLQLYREAAPREAPEQHDPEQSDQPQTDGDVSGRWAVAPAPAVPAAEPWHPPAQVVADAGAQLEITFFQQVNAALGNGRCVVVNTRSHEVMTEVLSHFVSAEAGRPAAELRVAYTDGSEARPLPLRCLEAPAGPPAQPTRVVRMALMSMRHLELDWVVDATWYRNREVFTSDSMAQADEWCYLFSRAKLAQMRRTYAGERVHLCLYHTGFEPAVLGLYRAVVLQLLETEPAQRWISVQPHYPRRGTFRRGRSWPPPEAGGWEDDDGA